MAIFYTGYRQVTKGRNANDSVHPDKGVGEYSNYSLWNTSHVLDGAPNNHHVPGTGYFAGDYYLSSIMTGAFLDPAIPLEGPGLGPELDWYTLFSTLLAKRGEDGQHAFGGASFGHALRDSDYSYGYAQHAADMTEELANGGHAERYVDGAGAANSFGHFAPHVHKGVTVVFSDYGQAVPDNYDNEYGHNKPMEWRGVPSAQIL